MKRAMAIILLVVSTAACTRDADPIALDTTPLSPTVATPPGVAQPEGPPVRSCESHVVGDISGWRRYATIVGPVGFVGLPLYADAGHRVFASKGDRYPALKTLLVIGRGPAVTVTILDDDRVRLLYDPAGWRNRSLYPLQSGAPATVFEPCDFVRRTQFNGALLVTGRTCATIEVSMKGKEPERADVPIGLATCGRS